MGSLELRCYYKTSEHRVKVPADSSFADVKVQYFMPLRSDHESRESQPSTFLGDGQPAEQRLAIA